MVEMGGLEPPAAYMRSRENDWTDPCCIRVFRPLRRFLPISLPTQDRIKNRPHGDFRFIAKIVHGSDIEVLRGANVCVTEESLECLRVQA